jgi:hypothetical protein
MTSPAPVVTLDVIGLDRGAVATLTTDAVIELIARCSVVQTVLIARLMTLSTNGHAGQVEPDRLLTLTETAEMLRMSPDYLRKSPAVRALRCRVGRELRFSAAAIQRFITKSTGRE